ncbi:response regulator [Sphingomonas sp. BK580]|uniref:response regulator n=1 Tax=Sphingomonas sp. BK580 TaxID=2586972 RepID=UPI00160A82E8|nr:response regulator [Sphingomonas sp. BK580]MBB3693604.1 signal transduction histidine kinase/ActR/RegA family two-component response regulator [Sphingomonas sp. BK580]
MRDGFGAMVVRRPGQPIWRYVAMLCLGTVLPTILCSALLLHQLVADQQSQTASRAQGAADRLMVLLDGKLSSLVAVGQALSTSPLLENGDLAGFRSQALRAVQGQEYGLVLQDADGRRLLDTRLGNALPQGAAGGSPHVNDVTSSGRPRVSTVLRDGASRQNLVWVSVPVFSRGRVEYVLSTTLQPSRLLASITPPNSDRTWLVQLVDGAGRIASAVGPTVPREGPHATAMSRMSPLRIALRGPRSGAFSKATDRARDRIIAFGLATTLFGLFAAALLGRAMSRSLKRMRESAEALSGSGDPVLGRSAIREIREVEDALEKVSLLLREQAAQRDQHAADLAHLNETLEARVAEETRELAHANMRLENEAKEREAVEAQLRQMQKLEAVGLLTGGIAHDFNNMLAVIIGSVELAVRKQEQGTGDVRRLLTDALSGAESAAALTRQLLAFGRQQSLSPQRIDLNDLLFSMRDMLQRTLGEKVRVDLRLAGDLWPSCLDRSQMESSLVNLAINARDAMPGGGTLRVETANVTVDDEASAARERIAAGDYTVLTVSDTGTGIPADLLHRVIDPFFTTKEVGKGSGLGLSQVHGFLRQSNGYLRIDSKQGVGTSVRLYVPRYEAMRFEEASAAFRELDTADKERTVLVVEDNDAVREASVRGIRELGYNVIHASSAEEALQRLASTSRVDLLFTDVVMPGMNGRELAEAVSKTRPDLKVVYATGYSRNVALSGLVENGRPVLEKPFTLNQLATFLDQAFEAKAA